MTPTRRLAAVLAALSMAFAGACQTDDAAKRDVDKATEDLRDAGREAGKEIDEAADEAGRRGEKALPGDADDDGR